MTQKIVLIIFMIFFTCSCRDNNYEKKDLIITPDFSDDWKSLDAVEAYTNYIGYGIFDTIINQKKYPNYIFGAYEKENPLNSIVITINDIDSLPSFQDERLDKFVNYKLIDLKKNTCSIRTTWVFNYDTIDTRSFKILDLTFQEVHNIDSLNKKSRIIIRKKQLFGKIDNSIIAICISYTDNKSLIYMNSMVNQIKIN